jgi:hypothetical protein
MRRKADSQYVYESLTLEHTPSTHPSFTTDWIIELKQAFCGVDLLSESGVDGQNTTTKPYTYKQLEVYERPSHHERPVVMKS